MKRKNKENFKYHKIVCTSSNSIGLINMCKANNIGVYNLIKHETGLIFCINAVDYKNFKKLNLNGYQIEILKRGGVKQILNILLYRIGLLIGLTICLVSLFLLNNRILQIHVLGLTSIPNETIISELKSMGIGKFSSLNINTDNLEERLTSKFNFSLVSIITKGNSLIINIKESLPKLDDTYVPITADYNMVIKSINVSSGTANVKSGDIVYKGDVLVFPYVMSGDSCVYVTPCAEIVSNVYFTKSYTYILSEKISERTGKKQLIDISISLGKFKLFSNKKDCIFDMYEMEDQNSLLTSYFVPITINKIYAYELIEKEVFRDFEAEKESLILNLKDELYNSIPKDININDEDIFITAIENAYLINIFLTSEITQEYSYYQ